MQTELVHLPPKTKGPIQSQLRISLYSSTLPDPHYLKFRWWGADMDSILETYLDFNITCSVKGLLAYFRDSKSINFIFLNSSSNLLLGTANLLFDDEFDLTIENSFIQTVPIFEPSTDTQIGVFLIEFKLSEYGYYKNIDLSMEIPTMPPTPTINQSIPFNRGNPISRKNIIPNSNSTVKKEVHTLANIQLAGSNKNIDPLKYSQVNKRLVELNEKINKSIRESNDLVDFGDHFDDVDILDPSPSKLKDVFNDSDIDHRFLSNSSSNDSINLDLDDDLLIEALNSRHRNKFDDDESSSSSSDNSILDNEEKFDEAKKKPFKKSPNHNLSSPISYRGINSLICSIEKVSISLPTLQKYNISLPLSIQPNNQTLLSKQVSWSRIEVEVEVYVPTHKKGDRLSSISKSHGVPKFNSSIYSIEKRFLVAKFINNRNLFSSRFEWKDTDEILFNITVKARPRFHSQSKTDVTPSSTFLFHGVCTIPCKSVLHGRKIAGSFPFWLKARELNDGKTALCGGEICLTFESTEVNTPIPSTPSFKTIEQIQQIQKSPVTQSTPIISSSNDTNNIEILKNPQISSSIPLYVKLTVGKGRSLSIIPSTDQQPLVYLSIRLFSKTPLESPSILYENLLSAHSAINFNFEHCSPISSNEDFWRIWGSSSISIEVWVIENPHADKSTNRSTELSLNGGKRLLGLLRFPCQYLIDAATSKSNSGSHILVPPLGLFPYMIPEKEYPISDPFSGGSSKGFINVGLSLGTWEQINQTDMQKKIRLQPEIDKQAAIDDLKILLENSTKNNEITPMKVNTDLDESKINESEVENIDPVTTDVIDECELEVFIHQACGFRFLMQNLAVSDLNTEKLAYAEKFGCNSFVTLNIFPGIDSSENDEGLEPVNIKTPPIASSFTPDFNYGELLTFKGVDNLMLRSIREGSAVGKVFHRVEGLDDSKSESEIHIGNFTFPTADLLNRPFGVNHIWVPVFPVGSDCYLRSSAAIQLSVRFSSGFDFGINQFISQPSTKSTIKSIIKFDIRFQEANLPHLSFENFDQLFFKVKYHVNEESVDYVESRRFDFNSDHIENMDVSINVDGIESHWFRDYLLEVEVWKCTFIDNEDCIGTAFVDVWYLFENAKRNKRKGKQTLNSENFLEGSFLLINAESEDLEFGDIKLKISASVGSDVDSKGPQISSRLKNQIHSPNKLSVRSRSPLKPSVPETYMTIVIRQGQLNTSTIQPTINQAYVTCNWHSDSQSGVKTLKTNLTDVNNLIWGDCFEVSIEKSETLFQNHHPLEFQVWSSDQILIGEAVIDLSVLSFLDSINGWYEVVDTNGSSLGQLLISIIPVEPFNLGSGLLNNSYVYNYDASGVNLKSDRFEEASEMSNRESRKILSENLLDLDLLRNNFQIRLNAADSSFQNDGQKLFGKNVLPTQEENFNLGSPKPNSPALNTNFNQKETIYDLSFLEMNQFLNEIGDSSILKKTRRDEAKPNRVLFDIDSTGSSETPNPLITIGKSDTPSLAPLDVETQTTTSNFPSPKIEIKPLPPIDPTTSATLLPISVSPVIETEVFQEENSNCCHSPTTSISIIINGKSNVSVRSPERSSTIRLSRSPQRSPTKSFSKSPDRSFSPTNNLHSNSVVHSVFKSPQQPLKNSGFTQPVAFHESMKSTVSSSKNFEMFSLTDEDKVDRRFQELLRKRKEVSIKLKDGRIFEDGIGVDSLNRSPPLENSTSRLNFSKSGNISDSNFVVDREEIARIMKISAS